MYNLSADLLQQYLKGELSPEKQAEVERMLAADDMAADALEGLQKMQNPEKLAEFVPSIQAKTQKLLSRKRNRKFIRVSVMQYMAAAAVILLLWLSFVLLKKVQLQEKQSAKQDSLSVTPLHKDSVSPIKDSLVSPPKNDTNTPKKSLEKANKVPVTVPKIEGVYLPAESRMMDSLERMLRNQSPKVENPPQIVVNPSPKSKNPSKRKGLPLKNTGQKSSQSHLQAPDLAFTEGEYLFHTGKYADALRMFQSIAPTSPFYREAQLRQAACREKMR